MLRRFTYQQTVLGETVRKLLSGTPPHRLNINLKENRLTLSNLDIQIWKNVAEDIIDSLDEVGIKYVLIKALSVPYVRMEDVDLLIEREDDIYEALSILRKKKYSLYRDRHSLNPLKITAVQHRKNTQVDIYPEPSWLNMKYAPRFFITSHRVKRTVWGIEAYLPNPTLDMYIVATHSYNHGFISLAEVAHVIRLILENKINWDMLKKLACAFKLQHALIPFLHAARLSLSEDEIDKKMIKLINDILRGDTLSRIYLGWFTETLLNGFPLRLPLTMRILSASVRLFRPSLRPYTKVYDELSGYVLAFFLHGNLRKLVRWEKNESLNNNS